MLLAVIVIGFLSEKGFSNTYFMSLISLLIGSVIIFTLGVIYLGSIIGYDKAISFGLLPFIPSELFKIALAVALIPSISKFIK
jgi:biotin transport system substrate-specific component